MVAGLSFGVKSLGSLEEGSAVVVQDYAAGRLRWEQRPGI
jgi:hypothetical protein